MIINNIWYLSWCQLLAPISQINCLRDTLNFAFRLLTVLFQVASLKSQMSTNPKRLILCAKYNFTAVVKWAVLVSRIIVYVYLHKYSWKARTATILGILLVGGRLLKVSSLKANILADWNRTWIINTQSYNSYKLYFMNILIHWLQYTHLIEINISCVELSLL